LHKRGHQGHEYLPATFAEFPPFIASIVEGVYVTPEVNWFPAPPLSATYNATSQVIHVVHDTIDAPDVLLCLLVDV